MINKENNILSHQDPTFKSNEVLNKNLLYEAIKSLKELGSQDVIIDYTLERKNINANTLLTLTWLLSKKIKTEFHGQKRIGIVLPPGILGIATNLAIMMAGMLPINLNPTLSLEAIKSCLKKADINVIVTVDLIKRRLKDFPWTSQTLCASKTIQEIPKWSLIKHNFIIRLLPFSLLAKLLKLDKTGGKIPATILFTSGSSGSPKAVELTHQNIIANIYQINSLGVLPKKETLLSNLPIFHSFGFTVGIWLALIEKVKLVTVPTPLEIKKTAKAIHQEKATVLISTPSFLKSYYSKIDPLEFSSLKYVIAGAEKTPEGFHQQWEERMGSEYLEGYGLTETTPVVSVNFSKTIDGLFLKRSKSVGKILPGIEIKTIDPETHQDLPFGESGLLCFKGYSVIEAYFDDEDLNKRAFKNGWLITGDFGRVDDDGFIYVEGRLSRFSKLAGEMVPHASIENNILKELELNNEEISLIVTSKEDDQKGEVLVILTTQDIDHEKIKKTLQSNGLPNHWIPKAIKKVEKIPMLASGKLDIKGCQLLAQEI